MRLFISNFKTKSLKNPWEILSQKKVRHFSSSVLFRALKNSKLMLEHFKSQVDAAFGNLKLINSKIFFLIWINLQLF
jgi:hypothetical protein